jgi:tetratricopeptide (TPR) repeat protein
MSGEIRDPALAARHRAAAAIERRDYEAAASEARLAIGLDPSGGEGQALLSLALLHLRRYDAALRAADWGAMQAPESEGLQRLRSAALLQQDQPAAALEAADEAVRLDAGSGPAHFARGVVLEVLSRPDEAEAAYRRAAALDPEDPDVQASLGSLVLERDAPAAERCFRASLARRPRQALVLSNLGAALEKQGRPLEAALAYSSALLLEPRRASLRRASLRRARRLLPRPPGRLLPAVGLVGTALWLALAVIVGLEGSGADAAPLVPLLGLALPALLVGTAGARLSRQRLRGQIRRLAERDPELYGIYARLSAEQGGRIS